MSEMLTITSEAQGAVTVVELAHNPPAHTFDSEFIEHCIEVLGRPELRAGGALVLTASGSIFSAGLDLQRLVAEGSDYIDHIIPRLEQLFRVLAEFPRPVVGAANGHAIAAGCVLLAACDRRMMAAGRYRIGVPALKLGAPLPPLALELIRECVRPSDLAEVAYGGQSFAAERAVELGLIDEVVAADDLRARAVELAGQLAVIPRESFRWTKALCRQPMFDRVARAQAVLGPQILAAWQSPGVRAALEAYVEKTLGRR